MGRILKWPPKFPVPDVCSLYNPPECETMNIMGFNAMIKWYYITKGEEFCRCH